MTTSPGTVMRIYFHLHDTGLWEQVLAVLEGISPRVQAHPANFSADVDLTGALRYWDRDRAIVKTCGSAVAQLRFDRSLVSPPGAESSSLRSLA
ncbi:hypothetical protein ACIRJR_34845, partial [Streptomyces sp. NPDC102402]